MQQKGFVMLNPGTQFQGLKFSNVTQVHMNTKTQLIPWINL